MSAGSKRVLKLSENNLFTLHPKSYTFPSALSNKLLNVFRIPLRKYYQSAFNFDQRRSNETLTFHEAKTEPFIFKFIKYN